MHDRTLYLLLYGIIWSILSTVTYADNGYMFTPRYIVPGTDYVVTVDLHHFLEGSGEKFDVSAEIRHPTFAAPLIVSQKVIFSRHDAIKDITLKIPEDITPTTYYRVYVVVTAGGFQRANDFNNAYSLSGNKDIILIQTDKGLYKAGQTVQFRIMNVNYKRIVEVKTMTIDIFDGDNNRVRRWANVSDNSGVFVGKMEMSQYPVLGTWSIHVTASNIVQKQTFKVKEFELPKFDVTLDLPDIVSDSDSLLEGTIKSLYTFGKGVTGSVNLELSLSSDPRRRFSKIYKLVDGEAEVKIELNDIFDAFESDGSYTPSSTSSSSTWSTTSSSSRLSSPENKRRTVKAKATVTEDITGNTRDVSVTFIIVNFNVDFKKDKSNGIYFRPGESFDIVGQITNIMGSPFNGLASTDYSIEIVITYRKTSTYQYVTLIAKTKLDIDNKNRFTFTINGNLLTEQMQSFRAQILLFGRGSQTLIRTDYIHYAKIQSVNGYYLKIEQLSGSKQLNVGETAKYRISMTGQGVITTTYKVISKGVVVKNGPRFTLSETQPYDLNVTCTSDMIPSFIVLSWSILPVNRLMSRTSNYVVAASIETKVKEQQAQETTINFKEDTVQPGDDAQIDLKSKSGSSFYILAVDKSILLLNKGNDITEGVLPDPYKSPTTYVPSGTISTVLFYAGYRVKYFRISDLYSTTSTTSIHYDYFTSSTAALMWSTKSSSSSVRSSSSKSSSSTMHALTTKAMPKDKVEVRPVSGAKPETEQTAEKQETVRKKFPNTWLFINVTADVSGSASVVHKVPDSITTWVANCFAISSHSEISTAIRKAELEVFMPFFISLQLPFSVIRNEQLVLQANVFNYYTEDLYVLVTLQSSTSFRGLAVVKRRKQRVLEEKCGDIVMCVFAKTGRATAVFFPIVPTEVGKIKISITADSSKFKDTVIKKLRVESEGAPRDIAYPIFIDLSQDITFETRMDLNYPPNTVEGSQRMRISLIGNIMGPTIEGLDRLVRIPYGCGEQNMITTAPSIFVYKYLKAVGKLTEELKTKAENYMRIGMQRQLLYRHSDWSFSAWGGSGSGSTWLTAFVLKVFAMASNYVDIYEQIVTASARWLVSIQNSDGSFPEKGNVIHRTMQGGSSGTVERITAYVLIALQEGKRASSQVQFCQDCLKNLDNAITKASDFLANNLENQTSVYTVAISAYALTITNHNGASRARNILDGLSKGGADQKYWEEKSQPPVSRFHYGRSTQTSSIEMTAYGLLAFFEAKSLTNALLIQKWLIAQRNAFGGYISTQDTVIGLQALSEIAATQRSDPEMTIMLSYTDISLQTKKFTIDKDNAMVMQMEDISTDTKSIGIHAWGKKGSVAIFTVSLFYNINMDLEPRSLRLSVTVMKETINGFTLRSCVSWLENEISGMIVVEVGIPSGFEANRWGISEHDLLKNTEIEKRSVTLYYDQVTYTEICTDILVSRDKMVAKIKPVPCKAYEYYEPSNQVTVFYEPLSAKNSNVCNICGIECGCQTTREKLWFPQNWCKKKMKG